MSELTTHWSDHVRSVVCTLCDGYLALCAQRRERRRDVRRETAAPPPVTPPEPAPAERPEAAPPQPAPPQPAPPQPPSPQPLPPQPPSAPAPSAVRAPWNLTVLEPPTLPEPVPPWATPRRQPHASNAIPCVIWSKTTASGTATPASPANDAPKAAARAATVSGPQPELNFEPRVEPHGASATMKPEELVQLTEMIGDVGKMLGGVIGEAVSAGLAEALERLELSRARSQEKLVQDFEAALVRQEVRFRETLERHAEDFAAAAARRAEADGEALRAALCNAVESCGSTAAPGGVVEETSATAAAAMTMATAGVDTVAMTMATAGVDAAARTIATAGVDAATRTMPNAALEDLQGALQGGFDELRAALAAYQGELKDAVGAEVHLLARLRSAATPMDSAADAPPPQSEVGRRVRDGRAASG